VIINLLTKHVLSDSRVTNFSKSFAHKMAAKTSWHGTTLHHCHPVYTIVNAAESCSSLDAAQRFSVVASCLNYKGVFYADAAE